MRSNSSYKSSARLAFIALIATLLSLGLSGCSANGDVTASTAGSAASQEAIRIRVADTNTNPIFKLAKDKGYFANNGLDVEIINFATPAEGVNALFIKQVDIAYGADFPLLNAISKGNYSIIASAGQSTDEAAAQWKLYARGNIQSPVDLEGKKLSFLRGTFLPYLWDEYFKENGGKLSAAELIGQGSFDEAFIALKQGDIDAAWFTGSALIDKLDKLDDVHQLSDMSKTGVRLGMGLVAANELVEERGDAATGFLRAVDQAAVYALNHTDEVAELMFREVKQPKEITLKDLPNNPWNLGFTQAAYDSLNTQKKYMVENKIIAQDFDLAAKLRLEPLTKGLPDKLTYEQQLQSQ